MTSNSDKRMFSILVSYFDEMKVESVVKDYEYIDCKGVNVKKIFAEICKLFNRDEIPCGNLVSELFDSTNYIRGKKSGFETKLCEKAPHLLHIDGYLCHHIHNTIKKFCAPFNNFLENNG